MAMKLVLEEEFGIQIFERSDIFLTTKIPTAVKDYQKTKLAINDAWDRFSLDYIDLLLIHSPQSWIELNRTSNRYFEGNLENWRAIGKQSKREKLEQSEFQIFLMNILRILLQMAR